VSRRVVFQPYFQPARLTPREGARPSLTLSALVTPEAGCTAPDRHAACASHKLLTPEPESAEGALGPPGVDVKLLKPTVEAVSAIELLKAFIGADRMTNTQLAWRVGIHLTFVVSGVLFALTDRIVEGKTEGH